MADLADERVRIARELHDGIAQDLAAIGYSLDAEIGRTDTSAESRAALRALREEVTSLNSKMRDEIFRLRSASAPLPHEHLVSDLEDLPIDFQITGELPPESLGIALGKTLLELARNACEHSDATELQIDIFDSKISFRSNGKLIATKKTPGFGLVGIIERLDAIGWALEISDDYTEINLLDSH